MDSFEEPLEMADLSELGIFVHDESLKKADLVVEDLIDYENLKIIDIQEIAEIIEKSDVSFRF